MASRPMARTGMMTAKATDIFLLITKDIMKANTSIMGHLTAVRIIIIYDI